MFKRVKRFLLTLIVILLVAGVGLGGYAYIKFKDIWGDPLAVLRGVMDDLDLSKIINYGGNSYKYDKAIMFYGCKLWDADRTRCFKYISACQNRNYI